MKYDMGKTPINLERKKEKSSIPSENLMTVRKRGQKARRLVIGNLEEEIARARSLLQPDEIKVPAAVVEIIYFLCKRDVGFVLSRNPIATSCRDARSKRYRLGHVGIPLCDELKSIVGRIEVPSRPLWYVVVHCRSDMDIDFRRVQEALHVTSEFKFIKEDELTEQFGMTYGTVNPFQLVTWDPEQKVTQIFDVGLLEEVVNLPGTMMTNAGDYTWAIEFDPREIVDAIDNKIIASVAIPNQDPAIHEVRPRLNPRSIGIITGNGPDSGIALWNYINEEVVNILGRNFCGDLSLPRVRVESVPVIGLSMELDRREDVVWEALSEAVESLCKQDVAILCLACHTTHYFAPRIKEICRSHGKTFISMADVVLDYVKSLDIDELALLGISYVADLGIWSAYSGLGDLRMEQLSDEALEAFHELGFYVKQHGPDYRGFQNFLNLLKREVHSRHIVIALTEISVLLQAQKKKRKSEHVVIDALKLYGKAVARASLGLPWRIEASEEL